METTQPTIAWLSADRYRRPGTRNRWAWGASVALTNPYVTKWIDGYATKAEALAAGRAWAAEQGAR